MRIEINTTNDWSSLAARGLTTVVDPMVLRAGEKFLNGAAGPEPPDRLWDFLSRNVHALAMFFDTLILEDRVPVFNYGDTFDSHLNFRDRVFGVLQDPEDILVDVDVKYVPYWDAKQAALAELAKVYSGPAKVQPQVADDILAELAASEYDWHPGLGALGDTLDSPREKQLAAFLLGGLIFAAYAQMLDGQHVVQPKRSRVLLALSLGASRANFGMEEELFGELKKRARSSVTDLPWRPTFLPHLLSTCNTPEEMIARALVLRRSAEVREYRKWLSEALNEWEANGELVSKQRDLKAIARAVDRAIGVAGVAPKVEVKVSVANVVALTPPGAVDFTPTLAALWGWSFSGLPGRRYRKLLTRAIVADHQYAQIENRLRTVWQGGPP